GQTFSMEVSIGPSVAASDLTLDAQFITDLIAGTKLYAQRKGVTISSDKDSALQSYFTGHVQNAIAGGLNSLIQNLATNEPVFSLGQLLVGGFRNPGGGGGGGGGDGGGGDGGGGGGGGGDDDDGPDCWIGWCDPDPPPPPPCDKWPPTGCGGAPGPAGPFTGSFDPNDKVGPIGVGATRF